MSMINLYKKFEDWFEDNFGWFFTNGSKTHISEKFNTRTKHTKHTTE
jgi:hypothetical protein